MERVGDWMQTFTGRQFWPLDPRIDDLDIVDIAAGLSKLVRYGGHCLRFYSVAEHSVLIARKLMAQQRPVRICRAGLLHDASESYLIDVIRPIKPHLTNYMQIENHLMGFIARRFDICWPLHPLVKEADEAILHDEKRQNMARPPADWKLRGKPLGVELQFWTPDQAFAEFMTTFAKVQS